MASDRLELHDARFIAPEAHLPQPLDRVLRAELGQSWNVVRRLIETGKVRVDGNPVLDPTARVRSGASIELRLRARSSAAAPLDAAAIVYVDAHVVVVDKPAGVSSVPFEGERGTLDALVRGALKRRGAVARADAPLGIVHRLDKETSGLIVFCRTLAAKRHLDLQFRRHSVERRYFAIAHGGVAARTIRSRLIADRGDGIRGSTANPKLGRPAVTHVEVVERLPGATLVACRLETGRTHQIRIHLAESGHPLLGERVYVRDYREPLLSAPRLMLHAALLGFEHPITGRPVRHESPLPHDMREVLAKLRNKPSRDP